MLLPLRFASVYTSALYFLSYCYAHHRDLHSFPTRRSSDLPWRHFDLHAPVASVDRTRDPARQHIGIAFGDRKSTRLNSSHLGISYAVFCLKKKRKTGSYTFEREQ